MKQNVKYTNIIELLDEIKFLVKSLENSFSSIEKDLALEKLRKTYECLLKISNTKETENTLKANDQESINIDDIKKEIPEDNLPKTKEITENILTEISVESNESKEIKKTELTLFETKEITGNIIHNNSTKTLSDQYKNTGTKTLSDTLLKKDITLSSNQKLKPIKNIKSAISINDRIMFSRDLFNNNNDLYNKTVDSINEMANFNEAENFINNILKNKESETFKIFIEIIKRRFT